MREVRCIKCFKDIEVKVQPMLDEVTCPRCDYSGHILYLTAKDLKIGVLK